MENSPSRHDRFCRTVFSSLPSIMHLSDEDNAAYNIYLCHGDTAATLFPETQTKRKEATEQFYITCTDPLHLGKTFQQLFVSMATLIFTV
ncbi:uncharacterized protein LOC112551022 isoform X2 [Alligator sinensis]|uniref:Uncharacterized protein LOC112551022 isoform X2 n=1 Tax=Alligator sinensis TaxID=38654 RepID=A0A3Q0H026_ALLSI|nr:uncharacterized protein LOC112551022 isoform X2 [Alligator sinensis]